MVFIFTSSYKFIIHTCSYIQIIIGFYCGESIDSK